MLLTVRSQIPTNPSWSAVQQINASLPSSRDVAKTSTNARTHSPGTLDGSTEMYFLIQLDDIKEMGVRVSCCTNNNAPTHPPTHPRGHTHTHPHTSATLDIDIPVTIVIGPINKYHKSHSKMNGPYLLQVMCFPY